MKKKFLFITALFVGILQVLGQTVDPVIMTIAGRQITRSEFEYSLNKNAESPSAVSEAEIKEYVDLFINYRLKVQAALDAKLDTLTSFKNEYRTYRDTQLKTYVYDSLFADSVARSVYEVLRESVGDSDVVLVSHILLSVPQNSNKSLLDAQKIRIDSIYDALLNGADFASLARQFSDDLGSKAEGGKLPWIGPAQVIPEFRDAAYALMPGTYSKPVLSPVGYHIIFMHDRKRFESYEEKRSELLEALNARGLQEEAAERKINRLVSNSNGNLLREDIMLEIQREAEIANPQLKYLFAEYYDGLLLYEAANRMVWLKSANDEAGLRSFFKDNKDKYRWDVPHMRGYVYRTRSKAMAKKIRKLLKSTKQDEGLAVLKEAIPADSMKFIKVHFGIYKQGDSPEADYLKFKTGKKPKDNKVLPYYGVVGKVLKQPADVIDVKALVVSDYQDLKEKMWVSDLRKKYNYNVDESVLSTVNKHNLP